MNLTDFTRPRLFIPALQAGDATAAIRELATALRVEGVLPDAEGFAATALEREGLSSTDIAPGWAMPHARVKALAQPWFALGRVSTPIRWGTAGSPVRLIILLAAPDPDVQGLYLKLIAGFARLNRKSDLADQLLKAGGGCEMFEAMREASAPMANAIS
jgi:PTS system fructose-specific IIC component